MKKIATLFFMALLCLKGNPCGNFYGYTMDGERVHLPYLFFTTRMLTFDKTEILHQAKQLRYKIKNDGDNYRNKSDYALLLMKLGKADSALILLRPLAVEYPNEYNINANLGTAYELTGQLDSALKYIRKDLELNPESHWGSEWIHEKILIAKIKEKKSPGWLYAHSILDLNEMLSKIDPNDKRKEQLNEYNMNIMQQIRTRVPFTPAPNKVITNLLLTLGDLNFKEGTYESALLAYAYALKYEESDSRKYSIHNKIKKLNIARDSIGKYPEVPFMFIDLMKRSELDPELLVAGVDYLAVTLDSIEQATSRKNDTIELLKHEIDSLHEANSREVKNDNSIRETKPSTPIYYALGGIISGAAIVFLIFFIRRKR